MDVHAKDLAALINYLEHVVCKCGGVCEERSIESNENVQQLQQP